MNPSREPFALVNMYRGVDENESHALTAMIAGWKRMAVYAGYFVFFCVVLIVDYPVNAGLFALFSRLEFVTLIGTHVFPAMS